MDGSAVRIARMRTSMGSLPMRPCDSLPAMALILPTMALIECRIEQRIARFPRSYTTTRCNRLRVSFGSMLVQRMRTPIPRHDTAVAAMPTRFPLVGSLVGLMVHPIGLMVHPVGLMARRLGDVDAANGRGRSRPTPVEAPASRC